MPPEVKDMINEIQEALKQEKLLNELLQRIRKAISEELMMAEEMPGVKTVPAPFPCVVVRRSALSQSNGLILSAEYYSPISQARIVDKKLVSSTSVEDLIARVMEMIETKQVKIGTEQHPLNPQTIKILHRFIAT